MRVVLLLAMIAGTAAEPRRDGYPGYPPDHAGVAQESPPGDSPDHGVARGTPGAASGTPAPPRGEIVSAPAEGAIRVDGRLDEPAWARATPFDAFVEISPREGATPAETTEVRFLHDARTIYVGIVSRDSQPDRIRRNRGPRDAVPSGDSILVAFDPGRTRRTGYLFKIGAGGVIEDRLLFDDLGERSEWDAAWEGAAALLADGWSAELAIPLEMMRFAPSEEQRWGVYVERTHARTHAVIGSVLIPLAAGGFVSRFGTLRVDGVAPRREVEIVPFVAGRTLLAPPLDGAVAPRRDYSSADLGVDFRATLPGRLVLSGALNPDFGQVEADPVILNLTRYETFFPEKRPLFLYGMELFEPVGGGSGAVPHQLVYTRRIGAHAPILGAARVVGEVGAGFDLALLDALVLGTGARGRTGVVVDLAQPLRIGSAEVLPPRAPAPVNYFAAALKRGLPNASSVGLALALATPMESCPAARAEEDEPPAACDVAGGNGLALDWILRSPDGAYGVVGQVAGSQVVRGPPLRILPDGTALRPGHLGVGAYVTAGKLGGEPFRFAARYEGAAPRLDLNATGFQPSQNEHTARVELDFVRPNGIGALRGFLAGVSGEWSRSADKRGLELGRGVGVELSLVLPGYHDLDCQAGYDAESLDLREIVGTGIAYERPGAVGASCAFETSGNRPVSASFEAGGTRTFVLAALPSTQSWAVEAGVTLRPLTWTRTGLTLEVGQDELPARFVEETDDALLFGDLSSRFVSVTLRQQVVLRPRLSLDLYAQLFGAYGRFHSFRSAAPTPSLLRARDLELVEAPEEDPSFRSTAIRANAVLRWEYGTGSVLHLVYTLSQEDEQLPGAARTRLALASLRRERATEVFLVKLSYRAAR